ncbi:MAG TPA: CRTAC1 family protein [Vicinamibacterales bacterium]|nr:CRTAC1 family protein [Vicinamibacterales bacterium]
MMDDRTGRRHRGAGIVLALSAALMLASCREADPPSRTAVAPEPGLREPGGVGASDWFVDGAGAAGIDFAYFNGMSGQFYFPEMLGGGVGLFDYDNDGDLDVYFAQGQMLGNGRPLSAAAIAPRSLPLRGRLFRNDTTAAADGSPVLHFTDVTGPSGIDARDYGMGVATADFDNDGCVDLYLTNFGPNRLYRNNCDGTFRDVSEASGTADPEWSVSAAFLDYDRDGWLDLYVGNYVQYSLDTDKPCTGLAGQRDYCTPAVYTPQTDRLYHNQRNGTFKDATADALLGGPFGPALGVAVADFNGDAWPDIYVTNDGKENLLWMNQRNGTFRSAGPLSGAALSGDGDAEGSMGVDAGDFDNDGDEDLFVTNLPTEGSDLYVNDGSGLFEDRSNAMKLGPLSIGDTGFGTAWFDVDNDGWLDLFTANGSIEAQKARLTDKFPYDETNRLFRNLRGTSFEDTGAKGGLPFRSSHVSRGAAFGDIDNDGDVDVVVNNIHGSAQVLINTIGNRNHWIGLSLTTCTSVPGAPGSASRRAAPAGGSSGCRPARTVVGARIQILRPRAPALWRRARADGSYASANDPRVLVGLGESSEPPTVRVTWPNGDAEQWPGVAIDRWTVITQGTGHPP